MDKTNYVSYEKNLLKTYCARKGTPLKLWFIKNNVKWRIVRFNQLIQISHSLHVSIWWIKSNCLFWSFLLLLSLILHKLVFKCCKNATTKTSIRKIAKKCSENCFPGNRQKIYFAVSLEKTSYLRVVEVGPQQGSFDAQWAREPPGQSTSSYWGPLTLGRDQRLPLRHGTVAPGLYCSLSNV